MRAECCCTPAVQSRGSVLRRARALLAFAPAATVALLIPKCPLCLAADLAVLGAGAAALSRVLLPVLCATFAAFVAALLLRLVRASRNRGQRGAALIR